MAKPKKKSKREVLRITEYMVSGGAYFWSGYLAFFVCDQFLHLNLWWAKLLANLFGWTVNYMLQRFWVFNDSRLSKHRLEVTSRYIIITAINFVLDYLIVKSLQSVGISPYIGQFVSAGFFTIWNYIWYRLWVFPDKFPRHKRASIA